MENASTEIGTRLRELREKKGLTIEDVSRRLKIPGRTLLSMESGNYEQLPHPVYARNFVKMYARELGMNPEELDAYLNALFGPAPEVQHAAVYKPVEEGPTSISWKLPLLVILGIGALAGGGWWAYKNLFNLPAQHVHPTLPEQSVSFMPEKNALSATPDASVPPASIRLAPRNSGGERTGDLEMGEAPQAASVTSPLTQPSLAGAPSKSFKEEIASVSASDRTVVDSEFDDVKSVSSEEEKAAKREKTNSEEHEIVIDAKIADCWIRVTRPGEENKDILLHKGQSVRLTYAREMTVRFGNIYGVVITEDGRPVESPRDGAPVRTLSFPL